MREREAKTGGTVHVTAEASDALELSLVDRDATVSVTHPDRRPLSMGEEHARLSITTDDAKVELELDGEALDAIADGIHHTQQFYAEGTPDGGGA